MLTLAEHHWQDVASWVQLCRQQYDDVVLLDTGNHADYGLPATDALITASICLSNVKFVEICHKTPENRKATESILDFMAYLKSNHKKCRQKLDQFMLITKGHSVLKTSEVDTVTQTMQQSYFLDEDSHLVKK